MTPEQEKFVAEREERWKKYQDAGRPKDTNAEYELMLMRGQFCGMIPEFCSIIRQQGAWTKRARVWLNAFLRNIEILEETGNEMFVGHGTYKKLVELKQLIAEQPGGE